MPRPNGRPISIKEAKDYIKDFISDEVTHVPNVKDIVVGNKIDLDLLKEFMAQIEYFRSIGVNINAIRIYHAKSDRQKSQTKKERDLVIVPVMDIDQNKKDIDFHQVYDKPSFFKSKEAVAQMYPLLIGEAAPCPNICNGQNLIC